MGRTAFGFPIWAIKALCRMSSELTTRFAAIRFMRLVSGNVDFSLHAHRAKATTKGPKKRECVLRKIPFNTDLLSWIQADLVKKGGKRGVGCDDQCTRIYSPRVYLGFSSF